MAPVSCRINQSELGHVANIDKNDLAASGGHENATVPRDIALVSVARILGEKAGAQDRSTRWAAAQVLLDRVVWHQAIIARARAREEYDLPGACFARHTQKRDERGAHVGKGGRAQQKESVAATHRRLERVGIEKIERDALDFAIERAKIWRARGDSKRDLAGA